MLCIFKRATHIILSMISTTCGEIMMIVVIIVNIVIVVIIVVFVVLVMFVVDVRLRRMYVMTGVSITVIVVARRFLIPPKC
jgi:hypothetical protein